MRASASCAKKPKAIRKRLILQNIFLLLLSERLLGFFVCLGFQRHSRTKVFYFFWIGRETRQRLRSFSSRRRGYSLFCKGFSWLGSAWGSVCFRKHPVADVFLRIHTTTPYTLKYTACPRAWTLWGEMVVGVCVGESAVRFYLVKTIVCRIVGARHKP